MLQKNTKPVAQHPIYTPPRHAVQGWDVLGFVNSFVGVRVLAHECEEGCLGLCSINKDAEVEELGLLIGSQLRFSDKLAIGPD